MDIDKFSFKYNELDIKRNSLIMAMGYSKESLLPMLNEEIDEVLENGNELCDIEGGYRIKFSIIVSQVLI
ncbi:MAG: hypothetical protein ACYDA4_17425 [Ignavibacteriaceae bacterium]